MALLAQINLNIPAAFIQNGVITVLGIHIPPAPANPPTPADTRNAVKLKAQVVQHLLDGSLVSDEVVEAVAIYESEIVSARQITLAAAAALPPGPLAGVVQILRALNVLESRLDGLKDGIDDRMNEMQRIRNRTGATHAYIEVLFKDGTRPTVAVDAVPAQDGQPAIDGRPALPLLDSVVTLRSLTDPVAMHYLVGYGIPAPQLAAAGRVLIARHIGCLVDLY